MDDAENGLSERGERQIDATARQRFPRGIRPRFIISGRERHVVESARLLRAATGCTKSVELWTVDGMNYTWFMSKAGCFDVFDFGEDNVISVAHIMTRYPIMERLRGQVIGSLLTAIQMQLHTEFRFPAHHWSANAGEVWVVGDSPLIELASPDSFITRRPPAGGYLFAMDFTPDGVHMHSAKEFDPGRL